MRLVTVAEAKRNMRILDDEVDEDDLEDLVEDASQIIMDYLKGSVAVGAGSGWTDSSGDLLTDSTGEDPITDSTGASVVPRHVRRATLLVIACLNENREGQIDPLTPAVISVLQRTRDPAVA